MGRLHEIYRRLRRIDDANVDRAMAAALPTADPLSMRLITLCLLERAHPEGTLPLVLEYHRLPADLQKTVVQQVAKLDRPLREAAAKKLTSGPANVIAIVKASCSGQLAYLVAELLHHPDSSICRAAANCLLELARHCVPDEDTGKVRCDAQSTQFVVAAVDEALRQYTRHQQTPVLESLTLLLPHRMPKAMEVLAHRSQEATVTLTNLLREPGTMALRRGLLPLLAVATTRLSAAAGLAYIADQGRISDALCQAHLMLSGEIGNRIRELNDADRLLPTPEQVQWMPRYGQRALPQLYCQLTLTPAQRLAALGGLQRCNDELTRLFALRRLIGLACSGDPQYAGANEIIIRYCSDAQPRLAAIALRHLLRVRSGDVMRMASMLINHSDKYLSDLARQFVASLGFDRLWQSWEKLTYSQQLAAGSALIKINPNFHRQLAQRLTGPDQTTRVQALKMVHTLNQGGLFEKALITLSTDKDVKVAASAVQALGTANTPEAKAALDKALNHPDTRVRANAVESLQQMKSTDHIRRLLEMATLDTARPRANAIGALMQLRAGDAVNALVGMLHDTRPDQRRSALWLVDQMGLVEVARHVAEMAVTDRDDDVRVRARAVVQHLIDSMGHSDVAADVAVIPGA